MGYAIISALSGLLGVVIGGYISAQNQRKERVHRRIREQLDNFYGHLLGLRAQILAKSEVRLKVEGATSKAWGELVSRSRLSAVRDSESLRQTEQRFPDFEKVIEDSNRQFVEEIMPLYREMVNHFASNMGLAKASTLQYFGALVEFVEIWDRWLRNTLPPEAGRVLGHSEDQLKPFYDDLYRSFELLRLELEGVSMVGAYLDSLIKRVDKFIRQGRPHT
ncbi:MAG: hypothetical protein SWH78_15780 [Thermodesulfobacteriota bacterium]|nr:hypothetical protein [Thermodesulfobacteriota bacterium]